MQERMFTAEESKIKEELRSIYGGHMTLTDVAHELGMKHACTARGFVKDIPATRINNRLRWPTGEVARRLAQCRETPKMRT